jgi:hypothetical protein
MKERKKKIFNKYSVTLLVIIISSILLVPYLVRNRFDEEFSVIIGQATIALIAVVIYYILEAYIFAEDNKRDKLYKKLIIVVLTTLTLILFQWIKPAPSIEKKFMVLVPRTEKYTAINAFSNKFYKTNEIMHDKCYNIMTGIEASNFKVVKNNDYDSERIALDNLELAMWVWLSKKYKMHWTRKSEMFFGISGGHNIPGSFRKRDDIDTRLNFSELMKLSRSNQLMKEKCNDYFGVSLPEKSEIDTIMHSESYREFLIKNNYYNLVIRLQLTGSTGMDITNLGERIKESLSVTEENILYCDDIWIELSCSFSTLWKGSEEQAMQKAWIEDLMNGLERDFSWEELRPEVEKAYGM